jgi:predicted transcriptional regulator
MLARQALNTEQEPLYAQNSVSVAIKRMEELGVAELAVIDETTRKLIGQVTLQQLREAGPENKIAQLEQEESVKIYAGQHIFEAMRLMLQYEMRMIPVVDKEQTFLGLLGKNKILEMLTQMLNLAEFGSVITVELAQRSLTLSEIVQLIEAEGAKILGITVEMPDTQSDTFEVSIKLDLQDVTRVAASLRRHDYTVVTDSGNEVFSMDVENRADELIKYLDM